MYSIGRFSKIMGISTKTLIWYDNIGLLKPDFVNEENGYRYYTADSIKKLANIQYFQSLDFSIDEIMHMSKSVIENKMKELQNKIDHIEFNLSFLEKLKEENMNKKILTIYDIQKSKEHQARIQGKWAYANSTNSFTKAIERCPVSTKPTDMPKELFFGEEQCGTDTKNLLYYSIDTINIKEKTYTFLIMNLDESLILFEREEPYSQEQRLHFHVYRRLNNTPYTRKDLEEIMEKAEERKLMQKDINCEYNNFLDGTWQHIDNIKESEISSYHERKKKDCFNILYPMFDKICFMEGDVAVMGDDDSFTIGKKTYTKENSMMKLRIYPDAKIYIENNILHVRHKIIERMVNGDNLLFINFTGELDTDENTTVYVYKKSISKSKDSTKKKENFASCIEKISDNEIVDYMKNSLEMSQELADRQMELFKRNKDIFDEFKYWFYNFKNGHNDASNFVVENPVEVQGYTAYILYQKFGDRLRGIGIFNLLISLRENPEEALDLIKRDLPRK